MDWSDFRVFLAAVRAGSISRAASALGAGVSTTSRRISALEDTLGEVLFVRTPAGLRLTPAGEALVPHAEAAERAVLEGVASVRAVDAAVQGEVTVSLPSDMLLTVLLPRLQSFLEAHPGLTLCFEQGEAMADLTRLESDIAVRIVQPSHGEELISTRLRDVEYGVFCRADRVAAMEDPSDPGQHRWIGSPRGQPTDGGWADRQGPVVLRSSKPTTVRHAVAAGLGTAAMPRLFGRLTPNLVELPILPPPPLRLYLVSHRAVRYTHRVAPVWEALDQLLRDDGDDPFDAVHAAYVEAYLPG